jgi:DNA-binding XRE family transcriptional regulator
MERFEQKFIPEPMSGCWLWTGCSGPTGYGLFRMKGKTYRAHRAAYELYVGPITDGMAVLHNCDNPSCVNPQHLTLGTQQDNANDRSRRHRNAQKLTVEQLGYIRARRKYGVSQQRLADDFGVSQTQISRICAGMRSGRTRKQSESIRMIGRMP